MKDIEEIDFNNSYFHFFLTANYDSIMSNGLEARIGENAKGAELSPKIFFSKGAKGILEICNVWIQWTMYKMIVSDVRKSLGDSRVTNQEYKIAREMMKSGNVPNYEQYMTRAVESLKNGFSSSSYVSLDIHDGEEFRSDDIDEIKHKERDKEFLSIMYMKKINEGDETMESWNMHTLSGVGISKDKITPICADGKTDALSVIKKAYAMVKTDDMQLPFLDRLIEVSEENRSM